mgnify:CR=1 FL=1
MTKPIAPIDSFLIFYFLNRRISFLDLQWKSFFAFLKVLFIEKSSAKKIATESGI